MSRIPTVRISANVQLHIDGTGWYQSGSWDGTPEGDALAASVRVLLDTARSNADGSVSVRPTLAQVRFLRRQADYLADASRDEAGWDASARADLNSARALVRRLDAIVAKSST